MAWGSAQEATGLLAGLNYFYASAGAKLEECGLFPAEATVDGALSAATDASVGTGGPHRPLLGASPDGLLRFPDGHTEVLEVKCHAPFASNASGHGGQFCIRDRGPYDDVGPWHIPQLMLEVYCAGSSCTVDTVSVTVCSRTLSEHRALKGIILASLFCLIHSFIL